MKRFAILLTDKYTGTAILRPDQLLTAVEKTLAGTMQALTLELDGVVEITEEEYRSLGTKSAGRNGKPHGSS